MKTLLKHLLWLSMLLSGLLQADNQPPLAPGYGKLTFTAPKPGTYQLPILGTAADGMVLDTNGKTRQLHEFMGDKVLVLSFIYSTCSDVNGCPLATAVLHKINQRLQHEPELSQKLRLLTLSFNPQHDTPEVIQKFGAAFQSQNTDWQFLTTSSEQQLQPIINQYQQNISKVYDAKGRDTGTFSHNLRVYLIDQHKQIRNIYSVSFLHADTLISDIKNLLVNPIKPTSSSAAVNTNELYAAGDNKSHYDDKNYQTHAIAISQRQGVAADLMATIRKPPLGLPAVPMPEDNSVTPEKISLGRKLFYDRRLSLNNTFSCAMCHIPEQGFTNNEMATAVGVEGRSVRRNSPTLYNVAYAKRLFHDSRETSLEQQAWGPLLAHNEMANPSIGYVVEKINQTTDYKQLFQSAFGRKPSMETIGMALASYQRTLNSANSAFDRWYFGKDAKALTAQQQRGFALFTGKALCSGCHTIDKKFALFSDYENHNTGPGYADAMSKPADRQKIQVAPGVYVQAPTEIINSVAQAKANDLGVYEISQNPQDRWKYKTPTLRNINLTAPYMHNGRFGTLNEVLKFYNEGGIANENLDQRIKPLHLTQQELDELNAFLQSLTGDNIEKLVSDAYAAPVGDME